MSSSPNGAGRWLAADAYLFDIDGTLLNSRDAVHYRAFHAALHEVYGCDLCINEVPVHGNTDPGILRAVLARAGRAAEECDAGLKRACEVMCAEVEHNAGELAPEVCAGVTDLLSFLASRGKLLGIVSGNLEHIGWLKLEAGGLRPFFAFGSFSDTNEKREEIFRAGVVEARNRLGRQDADVVIMGDTPADIRAARALRIPIVTLATGIYSTAELAEHQPDACFACCADLLAAV